MVTGMVTLTAVGKPTAVYTIVELVGWSIIAWICWIVYVVVREVMRPVDDAEDTETGQKRPPSTTTPPLPDSRATDSDRYTSLMPIIATIESSEAIAQRGAEMIEDVRDDGGTFTVSGSRDYIVALDPVSCTCPWWENREMTCKHIVAVAGYVLDRVKG